MEILFWFVLGIITILCISRYNENDKLFWQLLVSFIGTFAVATAVIKYVQSEEKKDKIEYLTTDPIQVPDSSSYMDCVLAELSDLVTPEEKSSEPVSKEYCVTILNPVLSEIVGGARDQPFEFFNTS